MTDPLYYKIDATDLLDLLSNRRTPALVDWAEDHNIDIRHVLDVRDRVAEPSIELRQALAHCFGLIEVKVSLADADIRWIYGERARALAELRVLEGEIARRSNDLLRAGLEPQKFGPQEVISPLLDQLVEEIEAEREAA